jgi:hypothetical protein
MEPAALLKTLITLYPLAAEANDGSGKAGQQCLGQCIGQG